jgi:hypothetical protein
MPKKFTTFNRQLLDGKQNNRLAQLHIKAPKPQATTYRNRHRIPKTDTIGLYRKQIERLQTNDSTYSEKFNLTE